MQTGSVHSDASQDILLSAGSGRQEDHAVSAQGRLHALLDEAVAYDAAAFDEDLPVDGGDLVEWFALWRLDARAALADRKGAR
ncbi:hypothetical protein HLH33_17705 [Gluconacetobacter diazotrophicus]|uniref:Uncharacterized protein n=1 Tax=Gluconacetobacter diazotrophicus TaxID=33996 RepID=A0A7W4I8A4_GLUDI|nr:hypothetical protein [Gluconacetobacter diazotrophicus]MBB2158108.1 hypothetical protein [Gluconacetobacter diazotrophicus]